MTALHRTRPGSSKEGRHSCRPAPRPSRDGRCVVVPGVLAALLFSFFILHPSSLPAISVGNPAEDNSPEAELRSFTVLDGFEVSLWASEKDGLTKPISMRWDERGRLWVITAKSYPQPEPGEVADDKVLILEDTKHTGHMDKVSVFADGLRMPMGLELAPSATWPEVAADVRRLKSPGAAEPQSPESESLLTSAATQHPMAAYIGEGEKLWIMRDLTGEGHATVKEVVFSGFGTGDVHQNINSFTWTPDGALMFSQGLHNYSNVTTPWGGRRLYGAGFWMYRPLRAQLTPYPTGFPLNAWGTVFDDAGQPFTVAGAAGMFWTTPLLVSTEHLIEGRALPNQGQIVKQGMLKYCGVDIPRNAHWPADMHGELVSGGFFENCIYRHKLQQDKANPSGYEALRQPNLITSSSVAFRPVDVKFGPDGALYISDWYNPIIGHYQASFRHPDRDKSHGRIWRVVKKGSPLVKMRELDKMDVGALLGVLEKGERWEQYQTQRLLMGKKKEDVLKQANERVKSLSHPSNLRSELEKESLMCVKAHLWFEETSWTNAEELGTLVTASLASNSASRAFVTRMVPSFDIPADKQLLFLRDAVDDVDPRVRLEGIAACAHIPCPESIAIALTSLDAVEAGRVKPAQVKSGIAPNKRPDFLKSKTGPTVPTFEGDTSDGEFLGPLSVRAATSVQQPAFDSFHARTLEAAVFALAPYWEPALREGKLNLPPGHLAWLLDKKSDESLLTTTREMLRNSFKINSRPVQTFDAEDKRALLLLFAKRGDSDDVAFALDQCRYGKGRAADVELLGQLADLVESQPIGAPANAEFVLNMLSDLGYHEQNFPLMIKNADRLIGLWKVSTLIPKLKTALQAESLPPDAKRHAFVALARLNAERNLILAYAANPQQPYAVRAGAIEALTIRDITPAAKAAVALMPQAKTEEDMRALLAPFLVKAGRAKPLIAAITETPPSKEAADLASRALAMMGRNEPELSAALNKILGRTAAVMPYDAQWVSSLANEATVAGNAKKGDEIFHRPALACVGCHQIGNVGGIIGPQLDAVGRGVPVELLVEAVMWPQRQIKEGYVATTVVMKDGRSLVGYKVKETDTELTVRDLAINTQTTLQKSQMQTRTDAGSLMPDGLTASLSREELRDLMAYLASLGKEEK